MEQYEFNNGKYHLVFYRKENDSKFSFLVKDNEKLTETLNNSVSTKRIKESGIKYAAPALFQKLSEINFSENNNNLKTNNMETNPIIALNEKVQKLFGKNIETFVLGKTGPDHCPTVHVKIVLPDGSEFYDFGSNQKEAKKKAAINALNNM